MNWKTWLQAFIAAVVSGVANTLSLVFIAPESFSFSDLPKLGKAAMAGCIISAILYLKKSPIPEASASAGNPPSNGRSFAILLPFLLATALGAIVSGCAMDLGSRVHRQAVDTNGVATIENATVRPSITFGDATQTKAKQRLSNTRTGNSIGITEESQQSTSTNLPAIIGSAGQLIGEAAKAFVKP